MLVNFGEMSNGFFGPGYNIPGTRVPGYDQNQQPGMLLSSTSGGDKDVDDGRTSHGPALECLFRGRDDADFCPFNVSCCS